jgi:Protein of unknown function (DUF2817)
MGGDEHFSSDYKQARSKFLAAARAAEAQLSNYPKPGQTAPDAPELAIDVAEIKSGEQTELLLIISGTHGVEGFCGSGCQVGFLRDRVYAALPKTVGVALVHALNPYGFARLRRVNEDNVDLNRNFHDFKGPLPSSTAYEEIHDWLVPQSWEGPARQHADSEIENYIKKHRMPALQAAVQGGQYSRPDGLFFGGTRETWSNETLKVIMKQLLTASVRHVAVIDLHTGLGPPGYGEPIYPGNDLQEYLRALKWFGPEVTSTAKGDSTSAPVSGSVADGIRACAGATGCTYIALEFGTVPILQVLTALRADHWLYARADEQHPLRREIKQGIRDAFYVDEPWWRAAIYGRFVDMTLRAARGLHALPFA